MLLIPNNEWPELFAFIFEFTGSEELAKKELAMMLLSVIIEYFSQNEINTYYSTLNPIIESYLKSDSPSLKKLAIETVNNLTQTGSGSAVKVLRQYPNLIPLVLNAIDLSQEDMIKKIFETLKEFIPNKKVIRPHLEMLVEAALNISMNTDLQSNLREATINFLEELGDDFGKYMSKKMPVLVQKIIAAGFTIAAEDDEDKDE